MKKVILVVVSSIFSITVLITCQGEQGPAGPAGQDGEIIYIYTNGNVASSYRLTNSYPFNFWPVDINYVVMFSNDIIDLEDYCRLYCYDTNGTIGVYEANVFGAQGENYITLLSDLTNEWAAKWVLVGLKP